ENLRRATGITRITQKKLLFALEATFVIRPIPLEGDSSGSALMFEDQAEVTTLAQDRLAAEQRWAGLIFRNVREQTAYRIGENVDFFQYRTRAGVNVPFAVRAPNGVLGFVPLRGPVSRAGMAAVHSFLRRYAQSKAVLVTDANETRVIDDRTLLI